MAKKISRVLAKQRDYVLRPFALANHTHEFYPPAVATIAARDAIDGAQRYEGAIVYVEADQTTYQLRGGSSNADWVTLVSAGGFSSHTQLADIGTNTHAQIDTHIADTDVHFTQASISITESQISDLQSYALASHDHAGVYLGVSDTAASTSALDTTGASVNVDLAAPPVAGQILTATGPTAATWQTPASAGVGDILQIGTQVDTRIAYFTADKNLSGDDNFTWDDASSLMTVTGGSPEIRIQDNDNPGSTMTASLSFWDSTGVAAEIRMDGTGDLRIENADGEIRFDTGTSDVVVSGNGDLSVGNDLSIVGYIAAYGGTPTDGQILTWVDSSGRAEFTTAPLGITASGTPADNQIAVFDTATSAEGDANFTWDGADLNAGDLFWDGSVDQLNLGGGDLSSPGIEIDGSATATPFINLAQAGVVRSIFRFNDASDRTEISSTADDIELRPGNVDTYTFTQAAFTAGNYVFDIDQVLGAGQDNYVLTYDNSTGTIQFETVPAGGAEINDLTASVTWANVPDANITQSSVTQHEAALTILLSQVTGINSAAPADRHVLVYDGITDNRYENRLLVEADISDFGSYLTVEVNDLTAAVTWANVPDANITQSSVTQHEAALTLTEAQIETALSSTTEFTVGNYVFDVDQTLGAGQDNYVLTYDNTSGTISFEAAAGGGGGIGGSIADDQVAVGAATADDIEGTADLTFAASVLTIDNVQVRGAVTSGVQLTSGTSGSHTLTLLDSALSSMGQIRGTGSAMYFEHSNGETAIRADENGNLRLFYNNLERMYTTNNGIALNSGGHINFDGFVGTGDTYIASDATNVLSVVAGGQAHDFAAATVTLGNYEFDTDQTVGAGQDGYVLTYDNGTGQISLEAAAGGSGIASVLEDTSPQLGGNLDANGFDIALDATDLLYFNGQGGGTYIYEISANNLSFVTNNIERARIAPNLVSFYDDNVEIGGGSGSQVSLYLDAQVSTGDTAIYFRSGGVTGGLIFYDRSENSLDLYAGNSLAHRVRSSNTLLGPNDTTQYTLLRGQTNALLGLSGGSGTASGFNMLLYGQSTTSFANDFVMRANTTELLRYDHSLESFQFNRPAYFVEQTLTDAANIAWDLNINQAATVTLAGNRTLDNPTNQQAGASYTLRIVQDGTGNRTLGYGTAYKFPSGTAPTLSTGANDVDLLCCVSDGTNMLCVLSNDFS